MELALPESTSPRGGSEKSGHTHRAAVRGVRGGGVLRGGLGHEHQVEVWIVGRVEENQPQHGALWAPWLRQWAVG